MASDIDSWRFYLLISLLPVAASSWPGLVQLRLAYFLLDHTFKICMFRVNIRSTHLWQDPDNFARGGPTMTTFFVCVFIVAIERIKMQNTTNIIGTPDKRH